MANIQRVEASYSTKGKYKSKNSRKRVNTRYLGSKPRVFCYKYMSFWCHKTRVLGQNLSFWLNNSPHRLALRVGEASHLYTTCLVTRLWLQSLLTRLEFEWRVGTLTCRSLLWRFPNIDYNICGFLQSKYNYHKFVSFWYFLNSNEKLSKPKIQT